MNRLRDWVHPSFQIPQTAEQVSRSYEIWDMVKLLQDQGYPDPYTLLAGNKRFIVYLDGRVVEEEINS